MAQTTIEMEGWSFFDWIQANSRVVGIGAAIAAIAAVGIWFYVRSGEIKRLNAERGLNQAKQALSAGNAALAQTDLLRIAERYQGTPAGTQAAMVLAQLNFDQAKVQEGLKALQPYQNGGAPKSSRAAIWGLVGDGYMADGKAAEGAAAYQRAAQETELPGERATLLAKAGRALMMIGKNAEAKVIWERLANDPDALFIKNEAEIRLGELAAQPAGKS